MKYKQINSYSLLSIGFLISLLISSFSYLKAQHTFNFDTYNSNDAAVVPSFDNIPLVAGKKYCIEVVGTYSIWPAFDWSNPCGTVESAPMFPSPIGFRTGFVGFDMEHYFSGPDNPRCSINFPGPSNRIQISLDNGLTWFFPVTSTPFNTNHAYNYQVTGLGFPLAVRQNDNLNADDYGILRFNIQDEPSVDFGPDTILCNSGNILLDATTPNASYIWQDNSVGSTFNVNQPGKYWVEVTVNNCSSSDTILVGISSLSVDLGKDTSLCTANENLILNATSPSANYKWQDNSIASIFFVTQPGKYWVEVSDNNCTVSDTILVSYPDLSIDLGKDTNLCQGTSIVLDATTPNASYTWQDNSSNPIFNVSQAGKYWVEVSVNNCSSSDTILVGFNNLLLDLGKDTNLCSGASLNLNVTTPNASYRWQDNSSSPFFTITEAGTYWVEITTNNCTISDTILVGYTNFSIMLGNDTSICSGSSLTLDATTSNASYLWQNNSAGPTFIVTQPGKYWVDVDQNNCTVTDTINVSVAGLNVNLGNDTSICFEDFFALNVTAANSNYLWQDNSTNAFLPVNEAGVFWVSVSNQCETKTDTITISSNRCGECIFFLPNAFTPNNDNINDTFFPESECELVDYELKIYNRWGEMLYETNEIKKGWDGKAHNQDAHLGVYIYTISYKFESKLRNSVHGKITLIR